MSKLKPWISTEHCMIQCKVIVQKHTMKWLSGVHGHSDMYAIRHILKAQCAFKSLMIHEVLQFALRIAFRCVLHRCGSLDIRCWKLYVIYGCVWGGELQEMLPRRPQTLSFVDDHHSDFSCNIGCKCLVLGWSRPKGLNQVCFVVSSHVESSSNPHV